jgi:AcrR family transcriptional regulator
LRTERDKHTRRERLLASMVAAISEDGYERATVARVSARAGLSRPSFYQCFAGKEACFLSALEQVERGVLSTVTRALDGEPRPSATAAAIAALSAFARERPARAGLLMNGTLAAGPRALDARDRGVEEIARLIADAQPRLGARVAAPGLPNEILIGAVYRLLGARLRRRERWQQTLQGDLLDWIAAYQHPAAEQHWHALAPTLAADHATLLARAPLRAPPAPARGRTRHSSAALTENHRQRLIFAAAEVIARDGYPAASVVAITRAASLDGRVFYRLFSGKHDAFRAMRELAFQHAMAVTAGAFFTAEGWPAQIWESLRTFTQFLERNPALTRACLLESNADGAQTVQRFEDLVLGCTIFLQGGYQYRPQRQHDAPSQLELEAIALALLEIIYQRVRAGSDMTGLAGQLAYVCLAPFVGALQAGELAEQMLSGS